MRISKEGFKDLINKAKDPKFKDKLKSSLKRTIAGFALISTICTSGYAKAEPVFNDAYVQSSYAQYRYEQYQKKQASLQGHENLEDAEETTFYVIEYIPTKDSGSVLSPTIYVSGTNEAQAFPSTIFDKNYNHLVRRTEETHECNGENELISLLASYTPQKIVASNLDTDTLVSLSNSFDIPLEYIASKDEKICIPKIVDSSIILFDLTYEKYSQGTRPKITGIDRVYLNYNDSETPLIISESTTNSNNKKMIYSTFDTISDASVDDKLNCMQTLHLSKMEYISDEELKHIDYVQFMPLHGGNTAETREYLTVDNYIILRDFIENCANEIKNDPVYDSNNDFLVSKLIYEEIIERFEYNKDAIRLKQRHYYNNIKDLPSIEDGVNYYFSLSDKDHYRNSSQIGVLALGSKKKDKNPEIICVGYADFAYLLGTYMGQNINSTITDSHAFNTLTVLCNDGVERTFLLDACLGDTNNSLNSYFCTKPTIDSHGIPITSKFVNYETEDTADIKDYFSPKIVHMYSMLIELGINIRLDTLNDLYAAGFEAGDVYKFMTEKKGSLEQDENANSSVIKHVPPFETYIDEFLEEFEQVKGEGSKEDNKKIAEESSFSNPNLLYANSKKQHISLHDIKSYIQNTRASFNK